MVWSSEVCGLQSLLMNDSEKRASGWETLSGLVGSASLSDWRLLFFLRVWRIIVDDEHAVRWGNTDLVLWGLWVIVIDDELVVVLSPGENVTPVRQVIRDHRQTVPAMNAHVKTQGLCGQQMCLSTESRERPSLKGPLRRGLNVRDFVTHTKTKQPRASKWHLLNRNYRHKDFCEQNLPPPRPWNKNRE